MDQQAEKRSDRKSNRIRQKNKRGNSKVESNDSPQVPHRGGNIRHPWPLGGREYWNQVLCKSKAIDAEAILLQDNERWMGIKDHDKLIIGEALNTSLSQFKANITTSVAKDTARPRGKNQPHEQLAAPWLWNWETGRHWRSGDHGFLCRSESQTFSYGMKITSDFNCLKYNNRCTQINTTPNSRNLYIHYATHV